MPRCFRSFSTWSCPLCDVRPRAALVPYIGAPPLACWFLICIPAGVLVSFAESLNIAFVSSVPIRWCSAVIFGCLPFCRLAEYCTCYSTCGSAPFPMMCIPFFALLVSSPPPSCVLLLLSRRASASPALGITQLIGLTALLSTLPSRQILHPQAPPLGTNTIPARQGDRLGFMLSSAIIFRTPSLVALSISGPSEYTFACVGLAPGFISTRASLPLTLALTFDKSNIRLYLISIRFNQSRYRLWLCL